LGASFTLTAIPASLGVGYVSGPAAFTLTGVSASLGVTMTGAGRRIQRNGRRRQPVVVGADRDRARGSITREHRLIFFPASSG